jgi:hypothetical protein
VKAFAPYRYCCLIQFLVLSILTLNSIQQAVIHPSLAIEVWLSTRA